MDGPAEESKYRVEHDSMGEVRVPAHAKWRAQTQRAVENFPISRAAAGARPHRGAGPDQGGGGQGQRRAGGAGRRTMAEAIADGGRRGGRRAAGTSTSPSTSSRPARARPRT